ncbi:MAG: PaaI family thioesterase [Bacteroidales bacterium]|nr:PaaI family thioesterase [Bacteroidales bacterium]
MNTMTEEARRVFCGDRYAVGTTGIEIVEVEKYRALCCLAIDERHCNARDVAMGGVLSTLGDFAAAVAANSCCLEEDLQWVSSQANIHFLAPVDKGCRLMATCTAVKVGRTMALFRTEIANLDSGKLVATVETTMVHV